MSKHDLFVVAGIGGHLVKKLRQDGFEKIRAVDQKPISEWYAVFHDREDLSLDLKKAEACRTAKKDAASVYNLAAQHTGVSWFAGTKQKRRYNLLAPKRVHGRNSDKSAIQKIFHWEPATKLRVGMEQTYRWIYDQMAARERSLGCSLTI